MSLRFSSENIYTIRQTEEFKLLTRKGIDVIFDDDKFWINGDTYYELEDWFTFCNGYMACLSGNK